MPIPINVPRLLRRFDDEFGGLVRPTRPPTPRLLQQPLPPEFITPIAGSGGQATLPPAESPAGAPGSGGGSQAPHADGGNFEPSPTPGTAPWRAYNPGSRNDIITPAIRAWNRFRNLPWGNQMQWAPEQGDPYASGGFNPDGEDNIPITSPVVVHGQPTHPRGPSGHPSQGNRGPSTNLNAILLAHPSLNNPASIRALNHGASVANLLGRAQFDSHAANQILAWSQGLAGTPNEGQDEPPVRAPLGQYGRWDEDGTFIQDGIMDPRFRSNIGSVYQPGVQNLIYGASNRARARTGGGG